MVSAFNKIFGGKKHLPEAFIKKCMVEGGAVTISEKLSREHGWDGEKLMAAPVMVVEAGGGCGFPLGPAREAEGHGVQRDVYLGRG